MQRTPLERSILLTVLYSAVFDFPLTIEEITLRQIRTSKNIFSSSQIQKALRKIPEVSKQGEYYFLPQIHSAQSIQKRRQRKQWSLQKWKREIPQLQRVLKSIQYIQEVYITGSLAVENVRSMHDDIDLLVVCTPHTLWLTRLLVIWKTSLLGKYRLHDTSGRDSWCFNLWLESSTVSLSDARKNIYSAYEIVQARQIVGEKNSLLVKNSWVSQFLPVETQPLKKKMSKETREVFLFIKLLNETFFYLQKAYMARRLTTEKVLKQSAFFHPRNARVFVERKFRRLRKKYKV